MCFFPPSNLLVTTYLQVVFCVQKTFSVLISLMRKQSSERTGVISVLSPGKCSIYGAVFVLRGGKCARKLVELYRKRKPKGM